MTNQPTTPPVKKPMSSEIKVALIAGAFALAGAGAGAIFGPVVTATLRPGPNADISVSRQAQTAVYSWAAMTSYFKTQILIDAGKYREKLAELMDCDVDGLEHAIDSDPDRAASCHEIVWRSFQAHGEQEATRQQISPIGIVGLIRVKFGNLPVNDKDYDDKLEFLTEEYQKPKKVLNDVLKLGFPIYQSMYDAMLEAARAGKNPLNDDEFIRRYDSYLNRSLYVSGLLTTNLAKNEK